MHLVENVKDVEKIEELQGDFMSIEVLAVGDLVKFSFKEYFFIGEVKYMTDYDTVNVLTYFSNNIWAIHISDIVASMRKNNIEKLTQKELAVFVFGTYMVSYDMQGEVVYIPTGDHRSLETH